MAPVGYNFNAGKSKYHSRERGGKNRRIIIFIVLTIILAGTLYFFGFERDDKEDVKDAGGKKQYISLAPTPESFKNPPAAPDIKTDLELIGQPALLAQSFPKVEILLDKAKRAYTAGRYGLVRKYCYQILDSRKVPDQNPLWQKTAEVLGKANTKILFSDFYFPAKKVDYQVQPNDGLRKIAMLHNTSVEAVQRSNNMKLTDLRVRLGKTFRVYKGKWKIIISKSRKKLYLFDGKELFKVYGIGIGKQGRTPSGIFKTGGKTKNPDWYSPTGKKPFGSKENVLGTRWIKLIPAGKTSRKVSGLGIHGTWRPESIGKAESNGCLRLHNKDVEELFAILPNERKPVPVKIIE